MYKRFIVCMVLLTLLPMNVVAVEANYTGETKMEDYIMEAKFLLDIGFLETYSEYANATKGDLANLINKLFKDEKASEKYFAAYKAEEPISIAEACAVLIDMTGYTPYLVRNGNYVSLAHSIGILKGINLKDRKLLHQNELAKMFYNALNVDMLICNSMSDQRVSYSIVKGENFLNKMLDIQLIEGIVKANSVTSLYSAQGVGKNRIQIENGIYSCEITNADDYLGLYVTAFVNITSDKVVSIFADSRKNHILIIDGRDVVESGELTKTCIPYDSDGKITFARLTQKVDVIENGMLLTGYTRENFIISEGNIVAVDNDGDEIYDVVFINKFTTFVVFDISQNREEIFDRNLNRYDVKEYFSEEKYMIDENGNYQYITLLKPYNTVSLLIDRNGNINKMYYSTNIVSGPVKEIGTDESGNTILKIGNSEYKLSENCATDELQVGAAVKAYLDFRGIICDIDVVATDLSYGYLYDFDENSSLSLGVQVKVFTEDNKFEIFSLEREVNFNNVSRYAEDVFKKEPSSPFWDLIGKKDQLIMYKLNSNGKLCEIHTAVEQPDIETTVDKPLRLNYASGAELLFSRGDIMTLGGRYRVNALTKIFAIPVDLNKEEEFALIPVADLQSGVSYTSYIYNISEEDYVARALVVRTTDDYINKIDRSTALMVVDRVAKVYDESEDSIFKIYGYQSGSEVSVLASGDLRALKTKPIEEYANVSVEQLTRGSVIQYKTDSKTKKVKSFIVWAIPGDERLVPYEFLSESGRITDTGFYSQKVIGCYGKIIKKLDGAIMFNNRAADEKYQNFENPLWNRFINISDSFAPIIVERNRIYFGKPGDIAAGDMAVMQIDANKLKTLVIYKNLDD